MRFYFYPQSLYTCTVAFADIFNDIGIRVYDTKTNNIVGFKPVPLTLSPKEKIAHILNTSTINDVDPQVDNYLPRLSIAPPDVVWDSERMRGKFERRLINIEYDTGTGLRKMQTDVQVIPVTITFELSLWAKYMVDINQLLENIMPGFAPETYVSFKERNFGIEHKARIIMTGSSKNFVYEYGETERRILQWNLTFAMDGVLYKPMEDRKEILCNIISIANVPCKKSSFMGDKIIAYEPMTNTYESILSKNPKLAIHNLDASESYDLMVKYWSMANTNMNPYDYSSCVQKNCSEEIGPRPEWDPAFPNTPCAPLKKKPCIKIDSETANISAFWQDETLGTDNKIRIDSWLQIYSPSGVTISGAFKIPESGYPLDCQPVYTYTPSSSTSGSDTPPTSSLPPPPIIIPSVTGCVLPEYHTTG